MNPELDPERLNAYVDGELDESETRAIEEIAAKSPEIAAEIEALRIADALAGAAFNATLKEPVPDRLLATVKAGFANRANRSSEETVVRHHSFTASRAALPLAASLAALVVGIGGGYFAAGVRFDNEFARIEIARQQERAFIERTVNEALEKQLSGTVVDWQDPTSGSRGMVTPVRTYRSESGKWCREFKQVTTSVDGRTETQRAIACREPEGDWVTRAVLYTDS